MSFAKKPFVSLPSGKLLPIDVVYRICNQLIMDRDEFRIYRTLSEADLRYLYQEWFLSVSIEMPWDGWTERE